MALQIQNLLYAVCQVLLVLMVAFDLLDARLARYFYNRYKTYPLPESPTLTSENVSIIVPTIDTEDTFTECLRLWLANNPKEIIVITVPRDLARVKRLIQPIPRPDFDKIHVRTVRNANKRAQLIRGIQYATGTILALVDDDTFWPHELVLPYLLAPFENENIGASGGPQKVRLDDSRKDENVITPWEVAALRAFDNHAISLRTRAGADGGMWCLVGRTVFIRREILANEAFYHEFANETWRGKKINTGDDAFITHWVQQVMGWGVIYQDCPEATVTTTIKRDAAFAKQMIRWQRSTLIMLITHLLYEPGYFALSHDFGYMARKMFERLTRPITSCGYFCALVLTLLSCPFLAIPVLAWDVFWKYRGYHAFIERYPYCRKHIWAIVLLDYSWIVLEPYAWLTIANDGWLTRNDTPTRTRLIYTTV